MECIMGHARRLPWLVLAGLSTLAKRPAVDGKINMNGALCRNPSIWEFAGGCWPSIFRHKAVTPRTQVATGRWSGSAAAGGWIRGSPRVASGRAALRGAQSIRPGTASPHVPDGTLGEPSVSKLGQSEQTAPER
ncbi:hypothetical protein B0J18DRAFT_42365 [Chaetomium sp. MPI-SDFR-AT-0129]|nr:hypothetical protein B0J18DRAFT_42365 [Chaetomium sp. MPI-SDFR-AT-0129]